MNEKKQQSEKPSRWSRLLFGVSGFLRCRIINGNHGEPYLERYALLHFANGGGLYLHRFLASDPDRGLHDHPWRRALGLILTGGYRELRLVETGDVVDIQERQLRPGQLNRIKGDDFHRIVLNDRQPAWTLFMHDGKYKDWGFLNLNEDGVKNYQPHEKVTQEGDHTEWWRTAPRGRKQNRAPLFN